MNDMTPKTCHKVEHVLFDHELIAEVDYNTRGVFDPETLAKAVERAARDVTDLLAEHRNAPPLTLRVVRKYQDQCSCCGSLWEPFEDANEPPYCASCGAVIEKPGATP
jgi:hypothetical protein